MDHRLAIVIVPRGSKDPIQASRTLLERHRRPPYDAPEPLQPKFRYMRVGGWFDGLVNGEIGQERWSTVLRMLLDGVATNALAPFPGFGPETGREIECRIEADNTLDLDDIWPLAPCTIIVTPTGEWVADSSPERLDEVAAAEQASEPGEAWERIKQALFWEHRGATAVAWDLSWDFIGPVRLRHVRRARPRVWGSRRRGPRQESRST